jgi:hypothetical protein
MGFHVLKRFTGQDSLAFDKSRIRRSFTNFSVAVLPMLSDFCLVRDAGRKK